MFEGSNRRGISSEEQEGDNSQTRTKINSKHIVTNELSLFFEIREARGVYYALQESVDILQVGVLRDFTLHSAAQHITGCFLCVKHPTEFPVKVCINSVTTIVSRPNRLELLEILQFQLPNPFVEATDVV